MRANQLKIIRFNYLFIGKYDSAVHQTKAINKLRANGLEIPDDVILQFLAPFDI